MANSAGNPESKKKIAVLVADGCDDEQLFFVRSRLRAARIPHDVVAPREHRRDDGTIIPLLYYPQGARPDSLVETGERVTPDRSLSETVSANDYDGLIVIGGLLSTEALRMDDAALEFIRTMDAAEKPLATIGHASALLTSGDLLRERAVTGAPSIRDDLVNAGGIWLNRDSVLDGNRVSCRDRQELPALFEDFLELVRSGVPLMGNEFRKAIARARIS